MHCLLIQAVEIAGKTKVQTTLLTVLYLIKSSIAMHMLRRIYKTSYYTYSGPIIQTSYCKSMGSSTRSLYIRIIIRILGHFGYLT